MTASSGPQTDGYEELSSSDDRLQSESAAGDFNSTGIKDTFTVDQAVNTIGFGRFQIRLSLIVGLCWISESMEVMLLSVLSPAIRCDWQVSSWKQAFITTVVFLGMMIGGLFWGWFSDRYGRKMALMVSGLFLFYFGFLTAFSPTYIWLLLLRGCMGFFVGAVGQVVTLFSEFLPAKQRGKCLLLLELFWALGAALEVVLALLVMPGLGWRWLTLLSSAPVLLFTLVSSTLPESARYDGASGRPERARATISRMAAANGRPEPSGTLVTEATEAAHRGRLTDLLSPQLRRTTLLLWGIWWGMAFCYYGVILLTAELFRMPDNDMCGSLHEEEEQICQAACKMLTKADLVDLLWTTLAEIPGVLLSMLFIEKIGRKKTLAFGLFVFIGALLTLLICVQSRILLTAALFLGRGAAAGVFQAGFVYTSEVFPTHLRAIGIGVSISISRLGAMVTPVVAQVLVQSSVRYTALVYAVVAAIAAIFAVLLPHETAGRAMT